MRKGGKPISTTTGHKTSLSQAYSKHAKTPIKQSPSFPTTHPHKQNATAIDLPTPPTRPLPRNRPPATTTTSIINPHNTKPTHHYYDYKQSRHTSPNLSRNTMAIRALHFSSFTIRVSQSKVMDLSQRNRGARYCTTNVVISHSLPVR